MFKHILLPTDGSSASDVAIQSCLRFAKHIGARVTGLHVVPEFHVMTYNAEMLEDTREQFAQDCAAHARKVLAAVEQAAKEAGVACEVMHMTSDHPYQAIVQAAQGQQCDLIAMALHGRKGIQGFLLGSETQKVLTHSQIPVLVYR